MGRVKKSNEKKEIRVALCGNPNVGKSTLFNTLTGENRHTGNWSGKTVDVASGRVDFENKSFVFYDIPGTYSLVSHSKEEEIAADFLFFSRLDVCVYVCDATALARSLPLFFQIKEALGRVVIALNFLEEAKRHKIHVDVAALSRELKTPVIPLDAKRRRGALSLLSFLSSYDGQDGDYGTIEYPTEISSSVKRVALSFNGQKMGAVSDCFTALRLIEGKSLLSDKLFSKLSPELIREIDYTVLEEKRRLFSLGICEEQLSELIVGSLIERAAQLSKKVLTEPTEGARYGGFRLDKILCGRYTAYPIMALFLALCFYITLSLASYPSAALELLFSRFNTLLESWLLSSGARSVIVEALTRGVFGTLFKVVAVMLPPMAIFFPLFSLLEELGFLPRIAYNLDRPFAVAGACGKQALTMCMGFGCNAVGVSGARIIDSERERLLAILTNSFVPCNGRFPILAGIGGVFVLSAFDKESAVLSSLYVTAFVLFSVLLTFPVTLLLSKTLLRGTPSSFTVEMPPFRRVPVLRVVLSSLKTKVLSVLLRAVAVAAPMGLVLYALSSIKVAERPILVLLSDFLDPLSKFIGLDGVILLAFILALPASEMVLPIALSIYEMNGSAIFPSLNETLLSNGFTPTLSLCVSVFCLFHFPCSTTLITVYKETRSIKYTLISAALPTAIGIILCIFIRLLL